MLSRLTDLELLLPLFWLFFTSTFCPTTSLLAQAQTWESLMCASELYWFSMNTHVPFGKVLIELQSSLCHFCPSHLSQVARAARVTIAAKYKG